MKQIFAFLLPAFLILAACSKDKEDTSKTALLTKSSWYHMRSTLRVGNVVTEEPYSNFDICVKDDPYIFTKDGKVNTNQGGIICSQEAPYSYDGLWQFIDNETKLRIQLGNNTSWQIVKLTKDSLILENSSGNGIHTDLYAHDYK